MKQIRLNRLEEAARVRAIVFGNLHRDTATIIALVEAAGIVRSHKTIADFVRRARRLF